MHTIEQAKTLWCPMVRTERARNTDAFRVPMDCLCIADQCAMWRWESNTEMRPTAVEGASGMTVRAFKPQKVNTHGYCGLAGGRPT